MTWRSSFLFSQKHYNTPGKNVNKKRKTTRLDRFSVACCEGRTRCGDALRVPSSAAENCRLELRRGKPAAGSFSARASPSQGSSPFQRQMPDMFLLRKRKATRNGLLLLARWKGLEPPTFWFVAKHSIQLSYQRISHLPGYITTNERYCQGLRTKFFIFFPPKMSAPY